MQRRASSRVVFSKIRNKISSFNSFDDAFFKIKSIQSINTNRPTIISFANAHAYNIACHNLDFLDNLCDSDLLLRDGIGSKIDLILNKKYAGINLNGTDFIPYFLDRINNDKIKVLLIGAKKENCCTAVRILTNTTSLHVHGIDGYQEPTIYIQEIAHFRPEVIILGLGMPLQESLARIIKSEYSAGALVFNGGAILDFISQKIPRAPLAIRQLGFEWLFRLLLEPRRLFKRYAIGNFLFIARTISCKLKSAQDTT